jgi:hypothetical protein
VTDRPVLHPPADAHGPDHDPGGTITAMSSALLHWPHRRVATAHCLARVRLVADDARGEPTRGYVVLSELRDNPRGLGITTDIPGVVRAVRATLLPAAWPPSALRWYVHHGDFSTYDVAGADTLTQLFPSWDHDDVVHDDVHDHRLLRPHRAAALQRFLVLRPVTDELQSWPAPAPRAATE